MSARRLWTTISLVFGAPWLALVTAAAVLPLPADLREADRPAPSVRILDREGRLMREVRTDDGCRARWVNLEDLGERAARLMVAAEDRRFYWHPGVDPLAMVRALGQAIVHRRVVSGASTLTQQLARTVIHRPRTVWGKLHEMALALRIEWSLSKRQILEQYLNRAPFGPGLTGIEAASHFYFDKSTRDLSLAEAALLAGMPRGPSLYDPTKGTAKIERRRNRVLARLLSNGHAEAAEVERATREPISLAGAGGGLGAPHFTRALLAGALGSLPVANATEITTTLEPNLERETETLVRYAVQNLAAKHVTAAAVVVLENQTGEILAYVGSPAYADSVNLGENDGVLAKRQPGSTLKPFVYELALESLHFTAATVLPDVDLHLDHDGIDYHPQNYDGRYHGPVRLREALANSYNVPAVYTSSLLGPGPLLERLRALGLSSLDRDAAFYGPGLALGDGEVRLLDLANAYATLARGGVRIPVRAIKGELDGGRAQVLESAETRVITDILSDPHARVASFGSDGPLDLPFLVAVKTGTSKGFRDNWTVGYTPEVTVAVWVGNFDGSPMLGVSGVTGAGPLFREVMLAAHRKHPGEVPDAAESPELDTMEVCPFSGQIPTAACPHSRREIFVLGSAPHASCESHRMVRIDLRNGLVAGPACPSSFVEERSYEVVDRQFASWARMAARPLAPERMSPLCRTNSSDIPRVAAPSIEARSQSAMRNQIAFPLPGSRFIYDDEASSRPTVLLRALAPEAAQRVRFIVDGKLIESKEPPFAIEWPLSRGTHRVQAEGDVGEPSDPVEFTVQ